MAGEGGFPGQLRAKVVGAVSGASGVVGSSDRRAMTEGSVSSAPGAALARDVRENADISTADLDGLVAVEGT